MPSRNSVLSKKAVVAYVPALHAGYVSFFKKHAGSDLFILGSSLIALAPRMDRDIRALAPPEAQKLVEALGLFRTVAVIDKPTFKKSLASYTKIVMPDEDVSRVIAKTLLKGRKISFENVFLRWDKQISITEFEVPADRVISRKSEDLKHIREAFKEAPKSPDWWRQVGAVLVKGKKVVLVGHNRHLPSNHVAGTMGDPRLNFDSGEQPDIYLSIHGEADIVAQAAKQGVSLKGASLYATVFPCSNCARLLSRAGIKKLYYAQGYSRLDGEQILKAAGVEIILVKK